MLEHERVSPLAQLDERLREERCSNIVGPRKRAKIEAYLRLPAGRGEHVGDLRRAGARELCRSMQSRLPAPACCGCRLGRVLFP